MFCLQSVIVREAAIVMWCSGSGEQQARTQPRDKNQAQMLDVIVLHMSACGNNASCLQCERGETVYDMRDHDR
jgi:Na+-transporting NADH:ubiquinone oxidoreductase subunit NqrF